MKIFVKAIPNSSISKVVDESIDLFGNKNLRVKINKPAIEGKANAELIKILAKYFEVKNSQIKIIQGNNSSNKIIEIKY